MMATMDDIEDARDHGNPTMESETCHQQWAHNALNGAIIAAPYQRTDYDIRAACLEAAVRIATPERDVLSDARSFYAFLVEAK